MNSLCLKYSNTEILEIPPGYCTEILHGASIKSYKHEGKRNHIQPICDLSTLQGVFEMAQIKASASPLLLLSMNDC